MADVKENETLRERLKKKRVPVADIGKFLAYERQARQAEQAAVASAQRQGKNKPSTPVTDNDDDTIYTLFVKYYDMGVLIDGVNCVITGRAMAMVTFHGYKNKVRKTYPSAKFDVQLMREGDTFSVAKKSGRVEYDHAIADAFSEKPIIGAYCVITIDDNQYFEALNKKDFDNMAAGSKMSYLWAKWDSEFWLKSVIKRACKRHFYDIVEEIDKNDNEVYGQSDKPAVPSMDLEAEVKKCRTFDEMQEFLNNLAPADKILAQPFIDAQMEIIEA